MMNIIVCECEEDVDAFVAERIIEQLHKKRNATIGFATGSTPQGAYRKLIQAYEEKRVDFSEVKAFNLDEYVSLSSEHPCSFATAMKEALFSHINISEKQIYALHGDAQDMEQECKAYDAQIRKYPIDLQLLGIGMDGHIAYNEPGTPFTSGTHVVKLHQESITSSLDYGFDDVQAVPAYGVTQGIATIMNAKELVMIAKGFKKHELVARMLYGEVNEAFPSSIIQRHEHVLVVLDIEAARSLRENTYEVYKAKK